MSAHNRNRRLLRRTAPALPTLPPLPVKPPTPTKDPMLCARTVCQNQARCKHSQTGKLYCLPCARKINEYNPEVPNLIEVPSRDVVAELRHLTDPKRLKTDEEAKRERERIKEICRLYGVEFPEDVFDRYA